MLTAFQFFKSKKKDTSRDVNLSAHSTFTLSVSYFKMCFLLCQESGFAQIVITVKIRMRLPVKCRVMQFPSHSIYTQIEMYAIILSQVCFVASSCCIVLMKIIKAVT
jgi:hypothetical protein